MQSSTKKGVAPFIQTLADVVNSQSTQTEAIQWGQSGLTFFIVDQKLFSDQILSKFFKHSNFSSFVRQLNMYNFRKVRKSQHYFECSHQLFRKDQKQILVGIKRKPTSADIQFGKKLLKKFTTDAFDNSQVISDCTRMKTFKEEQKYEKESLDVTLQDVFRKQNLWENKNQLLRAENKKLVNIITGNYQKINKLFHGFFSAHQAITPQSFDVCNFLQHLYSESQSFNKSEDYLRFYKMPVVMVQPPCKILFSPYLNHQLTNTWL